MGAGWQEILTCAGAVREVATVRTYGGEYRLEIPEAAGERVAALVNVLKHPNIQPSSAYSWRAKQLTVTVDKGGTYRLQAVGELESSDVTTTNSFDQKCNADFGFLVLFLHARRKELPFGFHIPGEAGCDTQSKVWSIESTTQITVCAPENCTLKPTTGILANNPPSKEPPFFLLGLLLVSWVMIAGQYIAHRRTKA